MLVDNRYARLGLERGRPVVAAGRQVVPLALVLRLSGFWRNKVGGGFAFAHPVAVEVTDERGTVRLAIPDMTLLAGVGAGIVGLLLPALLYSLLQRSRQKTASA